MKNPAPKGNAKVEGRAFAPAKINLGLRVLGRRPDGYHDLRSLFAPLTVGDELVYETTLHGWEGRCDRPDVPMGEGALVEKAFRFASRALGYEGGLRLNLKKEIPLGAGLGGGSSDAAAVMRIVERCTGHEISPDAYTEIAFTIGADVPFFLKDGLKWVEGIGEKVTPVSVMPRLSILLVNPGISISTQWVYKNLKPEVLTTPRSAASLPTAFASVADLLPFLTNDLESVVLPHTPVVAELKMRLEGHPTWGADAALMSGSGSTVFGLYSDPQKRDQALAEMKREHPEYWVCATEILLP